MEPTLQYLKITRNMTRYEAEDAMFNFVDGNELPLILTCPMKIIIIRQPTTENGKDGTVTGLDEVDFMDPGRAGRHLWHMLQLDGHEEGAIAFTVFDHVAGSLKAVIAVEEFIDKTISNMFKDMQANTKKLMGKSINKLEI